MGHLRFVLRGLCATGKRAGKGDDDEQQETREEGGEKAGGQEQNYGANEQEVSSILADPGEDGQSGVDILITII